MGNKLAQKKNEKINIIKALGEVFNDPVYLYPIILFFLLLSGLTAYVYKLESISSTEFLIMAFGLSIIFLIGPIISRIIIIKSQTKKPENFRSYTNEENLKGSEIQLIGRDNHEIWDNYTGVYYAFNAPWMLEEQGNIGQYVEIHSNRYKNKDFQKCQYLYYYKHDEKNWNTFFANFERFIKFESMVFFGFSIDDVLSENFIINLEKRIENRSANKNINKMELILLKEEVPQLTFFHGIREGIETSILYFSIGPFMTRGLPLKVLYSTNSEFTSRLGDYFTEEILSPNAKHYKGSDIFRLFIDLKYERIEL